MKRTFTRTKYRAVLYIYIYCQIKVHMYDPTWINFYINRETLLNQVNFFQVAYGRIWLSDLSWYTGYVGLVNETNFSTISKRIINLRNIVVQLKCFINNLLEIQSSTFRLKLRISCCLEKIDLIIAPYSL